MGEELTTCRTWALVSAFGLKDARFGSCEPGAGRVSGKEATEALLRLPGDQESARCVVSALPGRVRLVPAPGTSSPLPSLNLRRPGELPEGLIGFTVGTECAARSKERVRGGGFMLAQD